MNRLLPYITGIVLVLVIVLGLPKILHTDRYRQQIADSLSQKLNHKVVIGKLDVGLIPPAIKLHDVSLLNPAGDAPLLQVEEIDAPLSLTWLMHFELAPQSLTFHGWLATVRRNVDGNWDWEEWLGPTTQLHEKAEWPLNVVTLDRGELHAVDPFGPNQEEFVIQVLQSEWERDRQYISANGVLSSLPAPVNFLLQANGRFASNPEWTGVLDLTNENRDWKLDCKVSDGHLDVGGQTPEWRFDTAYAFLRFYSRLPVPPPVASPTVLLQQWDTHFSWQGSTLTFTQGASLADGKAEVKGEIYFKPTVGWASLDLALKDTKIQQLESVVWGNAPVEGTATGLAHLEVTLSSNPWTSVTGQGAINIKDGRYYWPKASGDALAKAHMMRYMQKKYPGFLQTGMTLTKASANWKAHKGVFSIEDGFCNLGDIQVGLVGDL
jgi:hypothetical protein